MKAADTTALTVLGVDLKLRRRRPSLRLEAHSESQGILEPLDSGVESLELLVDRGYRRDPDAVMAGKVRLETLGELLVPCILLGEGSGDVASAVTLRDGRV
jgi:hypothetical protein